MKRYGPVVLPKMLADIPPAIPPDTAAAALATLHHWGAMDVAPALGLVPAPPKRKPPACACGDCRACRDARPWECPMCHRVMRWGSGKRHRRDVHGVTDEA